MNQPSGRPVVISKNVVNVHLEANNDTELVTQAFLGQPAWILEEKDGWSHVELWDTYRGWLQTRFTAPLASDTPYASAFPKARIKSLIADIRTEPRMTAPIHTKIPVSCEAELADERGAWLQLRLPGGQAAWARKADVEIVTTPWPERTVAPGASLVRAAKRFVGTPYLWGGSTPFGIDCSGFVQLLYRMHGFQLLRDAGIQARDPRAVPIEPEKLRQGDLVFFSSATDTERKEIVHVGMYIGDGQFIHAAGQSLGVTISPLFSGYFWDVCWGARHYDFSRKSA